MFDVGFSEVLLIFVIALVVLGPEKLPRLASQVGRWVGRARAMARQFREQLEEEVNLEQVRKAQGTPPPNATETPESQAASNAQPAASQQIGSDTSQMPKPEDFRADTFSHAHPTNEFGANPLTPDGAGTHDVGTSSATATTESSAHNAERSPAGGAYAPTSVTQPTTTATATEPAPASAATAASRAGTSAPTEASSPADEPRQS